MNARFLFFFSISLLFVNGAMADGVFQRTKERTTLVWNPDFQQDDAATWSGARDKEHYATGEGTLTWYRIKRTRGLGARVPEQYIPVVRYTGKMVRGKLEGTIVSVDDKGKTEHAVFVDGIRSGEWADGAPSRTVSPSSTPNEPVQSAERAETASSPEEKTEMSPVPKKVDRATAPSKAAEKRSEKPIEEAAFTPPPDKIELRASAPKTDYDRVIERGNARKAAASPSPTVVEQAKPSLTVEVAATKTTPTPSATNTPPPEQHAASTPAATAAPTARSNYSRRPPGRGASDPSDALRSLSLPPSGLRRAAELNGLTSPSSPAPTSSPTPSVTEPAKGQPSPTPNP